MLYNQNDYSVPPGNQKLPTTATIRLIINKLSYLKQTNINLSYRMCIWGSKKYQLFLPQNNKLIAKYDVRCSNEILMKYLFDMEMFIIQSFDTRNSKLIGNIYINLKRFFTLVDGIKIIGDFIQNFDIFNLKKEKIGQINLTFAIKKQQILAKNKSIEIDLQKKNIQKYASINKIIEQNNPVVYKQEIKKTQKKQEDEFIINRQKNQPVQIKAKKNKNKQLQTQQMVLKKQIDLNYSLTLQLMKLKNQQAQLIPKQNSNNNQSSFNAIIKFNHLKLFTKNTKQLYDKLTIVYPQTNQSNNIFYITTILTTTNYQNNTYQFNQQIIINIKYNDLNQKQKILNSTNIQIFFGEAVGIFLLNKILNANSIILKNKINQKYCQLFFNPQIKNNIKQYQILLYLGQYSFFKGSHHFLILNTINMGLKKKKIIPYNQFTFATKIKNPITKPHQIIVIQLWSNDILLGYLKLQILQGIKQQKLIFKNMKGQNMGWILIYYGLDIMNNLKGLELDLKRVQQQEKGKRLINNIEEKKVIEQRQQIKRQQKMIQQQIKKEEVIQDYNFVNIYLQILQKMRLCKDSKCKQLVDKYLAQKYIQKTNFIQFIKLATQNQIKSPNISKFCSQYPYPLKFQMFINAYLKYCYYQQKIRKKIQQIIRQILKIVSKSQIQKSLKKLTLFFGYIGIPQFMENLKGKKIHNNLIKSLVNYLDNNRSQEIKVQDFIYYLNQSDSLQKIIGSSKLYGKVILKQLLESHELGNILQQLFQYKQKRQINLFTQFQYIILLNQQHIHGFIQQQNQYQPQNTQIKSISNQISSNQSKSLQPQKQNHNQNIQNIIQNHQTKYLQVQLTFSSIQTIYSKQFFTDIIINKSIYLKYQQLPKTLLLNQNQPTSIKIYTTQNIILQGVFLPIKNLKKIILYQRSKQIGIFNLGQQLDSQIMIQINKKRSINERDEEEVNNMSQIKFPQQNLLNYISSDLIKIQIRSIIPSGMSEIIIDNQIQRIIKYPSQNTLIYQNINKKKQIQIRVKNKGIEGITKINLIEDTVKYPINKPNGSLLNLIQIKLSPYYGEQKIMKIGQKKLYLILNRIDMVEKLNQQQTFYFLMQFNDSFIKTNQFTFPIHNRSCHINLSVNIQQASQYKISLINKKKQTVADYYFKIKYTSQLGIYRHQGYLKQSWSRLELLIFEINYNDDFSLQKKGHQKMQKLFKIFSIQNLKYIQNQLNKQRQFQSILRQKFKFTFSEIHVLQGLIKIDKKRIFKSSLQNRIKLFQNPMDINSIFEQFSLYDFQNQGFIKQQKAKIVYKLIFNQNVEFNLQNYIYNNKGDNILVDLNQYNKGMIDYIQILRHIQKFKKQDNFFFYFQIQNSYDQNHSKQIQKQNQLKQNLNQQILKISLLKFQNLTYKNMPGTYLFKVSDHSFFDPIPRCRSYTFDNPPHIVVKYPCKLKIYNKQYGGPQLWKFIQIAEINIEKKIKILGGQIFFKLQKFKNIIQETNKKQKNRQFQIIPLIKKDRILKKGDQNSLINKSDLKQKDFFENSPRKQKSPEKNTKKQLQRTQFQVQNNRIRNILNQKIDLSKYNFSESDQDDY